MISPRVIALVIATETRLREDRQDLKADRRTLSDKLDRGLENLLAAWP